MQRTNTHVLAIAHSLLLDLAYGTVCQPSCESRTLHSDNLTGTQNASRWSLTAAVPSDSVFHTLLLTYILYFINFFCVVFCPLYFHWHLIGRMKLYSMYYVAQLQLKCSYVFSPKWKAIRPVGCCTFVECHRTPQRAKWYSSACHLDAWRTLLWPVRKTRSALQTSTVWIYAAFISGCYGIVEVQQRNMAL